MTAERSKRLLFLLIIFTGIVGIKDHWTGKVDRSSWRWKSISCFRFSTYSCLTRLLTLRQSFMRNPQTLADINAACLNLCLIMHFDILPAGPIYLKSMIFSWPLRVSTEAWSVNGRTTRTLVSERSKSRSFLPVIFTVNFFKLNLILFISPKVRWEVFSDFKENWVETTHCWTFEHMNSKLSEEIPYFSTGMPHPIHHLSVVSETQHHHMVYFGTTFFH